MAHRVALASVLLAPALAGNYTRYANPLFATRGGGGFGMWGNEARNPGAMSPHPFMRLGPDTTRFDPVLGEAWSKLNRCVVPCLIFSSPWPLLSRSGCA